MSRWKTIVPAGLIALAASWLLAKDALGRALIAGEAPVTAVAPDYAEAGHWLVYPETLPPDVWEAGWDVDLFLIPPWPKSWAPPGHIDPGNARYRAAQARAMAPIMAALNAAGPVYSPALRLPSPTGSGATPADWQLAEGDLERALAHYFETANRGRGVAIVRLPGSGLDDAAGRAIARLSDIEKARIVEIGATLGHYGIESAEPLLAHVTPQTPGGVHPYQFAENTGADPLVTARGDWLAYLHEKVSKPAEPLGDFETIAIAPIHTPDGQRVDD